MFASQRMTFKEHLDHQGVFAPYLPTLNSPSPSSTKTANNIPADLVATYGNYPGNNQVHTITKTLDAGSYYPIRIIYANGDGSGIFEMTVTDPEGKPLALMGNNLVQFSCDHSLAAEFPAFGMET